MCFNLVRGLKGNMGTCDYGMCVGRGFIWYGKSRVFFGSFGGIERWWGRVRGQMVFSYVVRFLGGSGS